MLPPVAPVRSRIPVSGARPPWAPRHGAPKPRGRGRTVPPREAPSRRAWALGCALVLLCCFAFPYGVGTKVVEPIVDRHYEPHRIQEARASGPVPQALRFGEQVQPRTVVGDLRAGLLPQGENAVDVGVGVPRRP